MGNAATAAEYRFYHPNELGSGSIVTNRSGQVVQRTVHSPHGRIEHTTGDAVTRHLFTGQEHDPESDLSNFNARYYDPAVGRFLNTDPGLLGGKSFDQVQTLPGAFNSHSYVANQPTLRVDPSGEIGLVAAALGAVLVGLTVYDLYSSGIVEDVAGVARHPTSDNFKALLESQLGTSEGVGVFMAASSRLAPGVRDLRYANNAFSRKLLAAAHKAVPRFVYRGDGRNLKQLSEAGGMFPQGRSLDLMDHFRTTNSGLVAASKNPAIAAGFTVPVGKSHGYLYTIASGRNTFDLGTLRGSSLEEVVSVGGYPIDRIQSAQVVTFDWQERTFEIYAEIFDNPLFKGR